MKQFFFIPFGIMLYTSCTRDPNTSAPTIADGSFQYKVNGNLITMSNISIASVEYVTFFKQIAGTAIPHTRYMFNGQKGINDVWVFGIMTDSLSTRNYTFDSTYLQTSGIFCTMTYNGQQSAIVFSGDNMNINITSYSNGFISGNFTAKFTPLGSFGSVPNYSTRGTILITEGQFEKIKCVY